jgi:prepilin-type N-terminal cleavage/methylation domain-containing protein
MINRFMHSRSVRRAFTLSELLIGVSILGLITSLTLPRVFSAVASREETARMKETIQAVQVLVQQSHAMGELNVASSDVQQNTSPLVQWMNQRLNSARHCGQNQSTGACVFSWNVPNGNSQQSRAVTQNQAARWVLPGNTQISLGTDTTLTQLMVQIDVNPSGTRSVQGQAGADQIGLACNISGAPQALNNGKPAAQPGQCQPSTAQHGITYTALYQ